jgi:hypothetical protein
MIRLAVPRATYSLDRTSIVNRLLRSHFGLPDKCDRLLQPTCNRRRAHAKLKISQRQQC